MTLWTGTVDMDGRHILDDAEFRSLLQLTEEEAEILKGLDGRLMRVGEVLGAWVAIEVLGRCIDAVMHGRGHLPELLDAALSALEHS